MSDFLDRLGYLRGLDRRVYAALAHTTDTLDHAADIIEDREGDTDGECAQPRESTRELRALIREFAEAHNIVPESALKLDLDDAQYTYDTARRKRRNEKGAGFAATTEEWEADELRKHERYVAHTVVRRVLIAIGDGATLTREGLVAATNLTPEQVDIGLESLGAGVEHIETSPETYRLKNHRVESMRESLRDSQGH